ncbi:putative reverse transcriptase zinc-binding domain-containing protein [Helianthus annuus]|uniref:Reverse transcriptase zinc-binding domain-containing protein n=1 Tax=Helianthus annuus TaxID=4232 RepID=A0A9K3J3A6_HELAN|nr:putative reverse transcriptase zinc-binding domain-containing protein [Helianthus annuus]
MWRAVRNRIPTPLALQAQNCFDGDSVCIMCQEGEESAEHLFYGYFVASIVCNHISG